MYLLPHLLPKLKVVSLISSSPQYEVFMVRMSSSSLYPLLKMSLFFILLLPPLPPPTPPPFFTPTNPLPPPTLPPNTPHLFYTHTHTFPSSKNHLVPASHPRQTKSILRILQSIQISSLEHPGLTCPCNLDKGLDYPSTGTCLLSGSQIHRPG